MGNENRGLEPDADKLTYWRAFSRSVVYQCVAWNILVTFVFNAIYMYYLFCYRNYERMQILYMHGVKFPPSQKEREWVLVRCGKTPTTSIRDDIGQMLVSNSWYLWSHPWIMKSPATWDSWSKNCSWDSSPTAHRPAWRPPAFADNFSHIQVDPKSDDCNPPHEVTIPFCQYLHDGGITGESAPSFLDGVWPIDCSACSCQIYKRMTPVAALYGVVWVVWVLLIFCVRAFLGSKVKSLRDKVSRYSPGTEEMQSDGLSSDWLTPAQGEQVPYRAIPLSTTNTPREIQWCCR